MEISAILYKNDQKSAVETKFNYLSGPFQDIELIYEVLKRKDVVKTHDH